MVKPEIVAQIEYEDILTILMENPYINRAYITMKKKNHGRL